MRLGLGPYSSGSLFGILDAAVVDADQRLDQAFADLGYLTQGRSGQRAAGALDRVGHHQDSRLAGLGLGPGIAKGALVNRRAVRVGAAAPIGLVKEVFDERGAVMLFDQVDDRLR